MKLICSSPTGTVKICQSWGSTSHLCYKPCWCQQHSLTMYSPSVSTWITLWTWTSPQLRLRYGSPTLSILHLNKQRFNNSPHCLLYTVQCAVIKSLWKLRLVTGVHPCLFFSRFELSVVECILWITSILNPYINMLSTYLYYTLSNSFLNTSISYFLDIQ